MANTTTMTTCAVQLGTGRKRDYIYMINVYMLHYALWVELEPRGARRSAYVLFDQTYYDADLYRRQASATLRFASALLDALDSQPSNVSRLVAVLHVRDPHEGRPTFELTLLPKRGAEGLPRGAEDLPSHSSSGTTEQQAPPASTTTSNATSSHCSVIVISSTWNEADSAGAAAGCKRPREGEQEADSVPRRTLPRTDDGPSGGEAGGMSPEEREELERADRACRHAAIPPVAPSAPHRQQAYAAAGAAAAAAAGAAVVSVEDVHMADTVATSAGANTPRPTGANNAALANNAATRIKLKIPVGAGRQQAPAPAGAGRQQAPAPVGAGRQQAPAPAGAGSQEGPAPAGTSSQQPSAPAGAFNQHAPAPAGVLNQRLRTLTGAGSQEGPAPAGAGSQQAPAPADDRYQALLALAAASLAGSQWDPMLLALLCGMPQDLYVAFKICKGLDGPNRQVLFSGETKFLSLTNVQARRQR